MVLFEAVRWRARHSLERALGFHPSLNGVAVEGLVFDHLQGLKGLVLVLKSDEPGVTDIWLDATGESDNIEMR